MILLLVQNVALQQLQRLHLWHDCNQKVLRLVLKIVDFLNYFSVRTCNNLRAQWLGQIIKELVLECKVVGSARVVFQVPLNFLKESIWHLCALLKLFEDAQLHLQLFICGVHWRYQISHVPNCKRVKPNSKNHPQNSHDALAVGFRIHIAKPHCCQSLKCPVETHKVLVLNWGIHNFSAYWPRIGRKVVQSRHEEPQTPRYVREKKNSQCNLEELLNTVRQFESLKYLPQQCRFLNQAGQPQDSQDA